MKIKWLFIPFLLIPLVASAVSWTAVVQWILNLNNENSAWSVMTKQAAVASNQIAANDVRTTQMLAIALGTIAQTERQKKNIVDYSGTYGQPESNLCLAISQQNSFVKNMDSKTEDVLGRMANFSNQTVSSQVEYHQSLQSLHRDFCSVSEAKQGLCTLKANGMQAWDSDYSSFTSLNSIEGIAEIGAISYVNRISATPQIVQKNCNTTACVEARMRNMAYAARSSMITNTLLSQISIRKNSGINN